MLFSTHILNEVEKICDRVIVINKGNIIEDKPIKYFHTNNITLENHFQKLLHNQNDKHFLLNLQTNVEKFGLLQPLKKMLKKHFQLQFAK